MFLAPLVVQFVGRGRVVLTAPLLWRDDAGLTGVPVGFQSDGVTLPSVLWPLIGHPYSGSMLRAAVLHDWDLERGISPRDAAQRFRTALRADGVGRVRAWLLFAGVRLFGPR